MNNEQFQKAIDDAKHFFFDKGEPQAGIFFILIVIATLVYKIYADGQIND